MMSIIAIEASMRAYQMVRRQLDSSPLTVPFQSTLIDRARRDGKFVAALLSEIGALKAAGEVDAVAVLLRALVVDDAPRIRLTPRQAAKLLHVSLEHIVKLIKQQHIESHSAGGHRRLYLADVLRYESRLAQSKRALDELAEEGQALGIGYN